MIFYTEKSLLEIDISILDKYINDHFETCGMKAAPLELFDTVEEHEETVKSFQVSICP